MGGNGVHWAEIKAEYVNTTVSLRALSDKYGVPLSTVKRISAQEKWSSARRAYAADKSKRVSDRLHEKDVKQTMRDIERVCRAAAKLIDKIDAAIAQLDKTVYIAIEEQTKSISESKTDSAEIITTIKTHTIKTGKAQGLIDTGRLLDIARALVYVKQVLADNAGQTIPEGGGVIELAAATMLDTQEKNT